MTDLSDLMSRDPANLTQADFETIVNIFREQRKQFAFGNMSAGRNPPARAKSKRQQLAEVDIASLFENK